MARVQATFCAVEAATAISTADRVSGDIWSSPTVGATLVAVVAMPGTETPELAGWSLVPDPTPVHARSQTHAVFTREADGTESSVSASWSSAVNATMATFELTDVAPLSRVLQVDAGSDPLVAGPTSIANLADAYMLGVGSVSELLTGLAWTGLSAIGDVESPSGTVPGAGEDPFGDAHTMDLTKANYTHVIAGTGNWDEASINGGAATDADGVLSFLAANQGSSVWLEGHMRGITLGGQWNGTTFQGAPDAQGGCIISGARDLGTGGWTLVSGSPNYWTKSVSFHRGPNFGTIGGNLQQGADAAQGYPEQVYIDDEPALMVSTTNPGGTKRASIGYGGGTGHPGPHTVRIGTNPANVTSIELATYLDDADNSYDAISGATDEAPGGTCNLVQFEKWPTPPFRVIAGGIKADGNLLSNATFNYCTFSGASGSGVNAGPGVEYYNCLIEWAGQACIRGQHDVAGVSAPADLARRFVYENCHVRYGGWRHYRIGTDAGNSKVGTGVAALRIVNCLFELSFARGLWADFARSPDSAVVRSNLVRDCATTSFHWEISDTTSTGARHQLESNDFRAPTLAVPDAFYAGPELGQLSGGNVGCTVNLSNSRRLNFRFNRVEAPPNKPAIMIAADAPGGTPRNPGAISNTVTGNHIGRSAAWDGTANAAIMFLRLNGGFFSDATIDSNRYWVPAGQSQWRETASPSSMTFAGWHSFTASGYGSHTFDVAGEAGLGGSMPMPASAAPYTPKYAGVF